MLNLSESTIHLRIKRLREEGIIRGFLVDIDPDKIGKNVMAFILIKAEPKKYDNVLKILMDMEEIYELADVTGEYYAIAKVRVGSREELARVLDRVGNIEGVTATYTMYVLRTLKETKSVIL
jgi:Transcriptional regulators